jgi:hypothetical protein
MLVMYFLLYLFSSLFFSYFTIRTRKCYLHCSFFWIHLSLAYVNFILYDMFHFQSSLISTQYAVSLPRGISRPGREANPYFHWSREVKNARNWRTISRHWRTQRGVWGVQTPPPEISPKFWQSRAEFPVPWKIDLKNLITIRVSPICKLGGTPDWGVTAPDPCSVCPLSLIEFVEPPRKKFLGMPLTGSLGHF